jgi:hypothetical protein
MSLEALSQKLSAASVCQRIADAIGVPHRYCDPDNRQRQILGICDETDIRSRAFLNNWNGAATDQKVRASHESRERFWLDQLLVLDLWPVVFVCGANHAKSFSSVLKLRGLHVDVVANDWAPGRS